MTTSDDTVLAATIILNGIYNIFQRGSISTFQKSSPDSRGMKSATEVYHLRGTPEEIMEVSCDYENNCHSESRNALEDMQEKSRKSKSRKSSLFSLL